MEDEKKCCYEIRNMAFKMSFKDIITWLSPYLMRHRCCLVSRRVKRSLESIFQKKRKMVYNFFINCLPFFYRHLFRVILPIQFLNGLAPAWQNENPLVTYAYKTLPRLKVIWLVTRGKIRPQKIDGCTRLLAFTHFYSSSLETFQYRGCVHFTYARGRRGQIKP